MCASTGPNASLMGRFNTPTSTRPWECSATLLPYVGAKLAGGFAGSVERGTSLAGGRPAGARHLRACHRTPSLSWFHWSCSSACVWPCRLAIQYPPRRFRRRCSEPLGLGRPDPDFFVLSEPAPEDAKPVIVFDGACLVGLLLSPCTLSSHRRVGLAFLGLMFLTSAHNRKVCCPPWQHWCSCHVELGTPLRLSCGHADRSLDHVKARGANRGR